MTIAATLAAAPAAARASWAPAATVSAPHDQIANLALASGPFSDLLTWGFVDLRGTIFGPPGARYAVAAGPSSRFLAERSLPSSYAAAPTVDLGGGSVAQLTFVRTGISTSTPQVTLGDTNGNFARPMRIRGSVWGNHASLAGNARGELLLAWISSPRAAHRQVWASIRLAGRGFGAPQLLSSTANGLAVTAAAGSPAHRTDRGGLASDMVVVFDSKRGRMLARVRPHGRGWGPAQDIGPAAVGTINQVAAPAIGSDGRVTVAWYHEQLSEGGPLGAGFVQVAVRPPTARRFLAAQTLERDPPGSQPADPVVLANDGYSRIVAFLAHPRGSTSSPNPAVVKAAFGRGASFGAAQAIGPAAPGTSLAIAPGPPGSILTWIRDDPPSYSDGTVYAALTNRANTAFGAPQQVSPSEHASVDEPAYSPSSGRWIVAWAGRPSYRAPLSPGPMVMRESSCQSSTCG